MRVMRRDVRIAENAKQHDKENYRYLHPCPPPRLPQYITAPQQLSQLPPAMAHSHTPPAASAPLDSPPDSAASVPLINTLTTLAASVDSGACSKVSRTGLEDCESSGEPMEDAPPPRKKQTTKMDAKDADINLLAMTDLSQCKKDPGDVAVEKELHMTDLSEKELQKCIIVGVWQKLKKPDPGGGFFRCSQTRDNPQRPWLTSLLVAEV